MQEIIGERVKRTRFIQTDRYVVVVEVDAVIPVDDPTEACYEPKTIQFLRELRIKAELGDADWLRWYGKVYEALDAAA